MKRIIQIISGCLLLAAAVGLVILSVYEIMHGFWIWLPVIFVGAALGVTGYEIAVGNSARKALKDLVSMLMWWA